MLGFLAPLLLFPFLTLFLAILNWNRETEKKREKQEKTPMRCEKGKMSRVRKSFFLGRVFLLVVTYTGFLLTYKCSAHQGMNPEAIKVMLSRV